jgi:hypothetical protein
MERDASRARARSAGLIATARAGQVATAALDPPNRGRGARTTRWGPLIGARVRVCRPHLRRTGPIYVSAGPLWSPGVFLGGRENPDILHRH